MDGRGHENEQSLSYYGCLHNLAKNLRDDRKTYKNKYQSDDSLSRNL